ncbi:MAG: aminoglycoside phosphotransferase [Herbinix sp.]|jgi:Ser/Thr protein kinase RdoA (MazF antagonist)|nr:aminoglycoside phosphotransferase [Herbinix sp.]
MNKDEMLEILCNSYSINFINLELLREGGCVSYIAKSNDEKYFLKLIPSVFMDTAKQSLKILRYLEEKKFPSPYVILTNTGLPYIELTNKDQSSLWVLFHYIEGIEPEEGVDMEPIGTLIGQLHNTMTKYPVSLPVHGKEFFIDRYIHILKKMNYDEKKIALFQEHGDMLWKRVNKLPRGYCHGDMHRGNLIRSAKGEYYLLDFDTSCNAFPMYDIMVMCNATNYFDYDENGYYITKSNLEVFIKGYSKYHRLSDMEINAIYDLIAVYHYQLQATIIEINGLECVDHDFLDSQLDWLMRWHKQCKNNN